MYIQQEIYLLFMFPDPIKFALPTCAKAFWGQTYGQIFDFQLDFIALDKDIDLDMLQLQNIDRYTHYKKYIW